MRCSFVYFLLLKLHLSGLLKPVGKNEQSKSACQWLLLFLLILDMGILFTSPSPVYDPQNIKTTPNTLIVFLSEIRKSYFRLNGLSSGYWHACQKLRKQFHLDFNFRPISSPATFQFNRSFSEMKSCCSDAAFVSGRLLLFNLCCL